MEAEEIVQRLDAAGLSCEPVRPGSVPWLAASGYIDQWSALLPTTEEQQALLALRAGCGARMKVCSDNKWHWTACCDCENKTLEQLFADTDVDVGGRDCAGYDTPLSAIAAVGRALGLGEGEKRG